MEDWLKGCESSKKVSGFQRFNVSEFQGFRVSALGLQP